MAISHFQITPQSRRKGASSIAKAAYNTGTKLHEIDGRLHNYRQKGGIRHQELIYFSNAIERQKRENFWQGVERSEKRKDACVSREIQAALPCELSYQDNLKLAQEFSKKLIERYLLTAADLAIHYPSKYRRKPHASNHENPHVHILIPDRDRNGKKLRIFCNNPQEVIDLRQEWENHVNEFLTKAGETVQISLKSNKTQIANIKAEIATLDENERQLLQELKTIQQEIKDHGNNGETFNCSTGQASGQLETRADNQSEYGSELTSRNYDTEKGHQDSLGNNQPGIRSAERTAGSGISTDYNRNSRKIGTTGKTSNKPRNQQDFKPFTKIARKIASRINGLRFERHRQTQQNSIFTLATKITNRLKGLRYERQHQYQQRTIQNQDIQSITSPIN